MAFVLVFMIDYPVIQIAFFIMSSLFSACYLIWNNLYVNHVTNTLERFNELMMLSQSYWMLTFTDWYDTPEGTEQEKLMIGWIVCGLLVIQILVNTITILICTLKDLIVAIKKLRYRYRVWSFKRQ